MDGNGDHRDRDLGIIHIRIIGIIGIGWEKGWIGDRGDG